MRVSVRARYLLTIAWQSMYKHHPPQVLKNKIKQKQVVFWDIQGTYTYEYTYVYIYIHIGVYMYIYIYIYISMYTCTLIFICMYVCMYMYIYTLYIDIYIQWVVYRNIQDNRHKFTLFKKTKKKNLVCWNKNKTGGLPKYSGQGAQVHSVTRRQNTRYELIAVPFQCKHT